MGQTTQVRTAEFSPGQMHQRHAIRIDPAARNTRRIQKGRALTVAQQRATNTGPPLEGVMHVAKHHQIRTAALADAIQSQSQVLITPVDRRFLPVTATNAVGIGAETSGSAMGHHDQRLVVGNLRGGGHDPLNRRFKIHGPIHRLDSLGQMKPAPSTAGSGANDRHRQMVPGAPRPATVMLPQQAELLPQHPTGAITTTVVVPQDHSFGEWQRCDATGQTQVPIAEIPDKQRQIRPQQRQKLLISLTPGSMQITGNGDAEVVQSGCLVWLHPARLWIR